MSAAEAATLPPPPRMDVFLGWPEDQPIRAELCGPEHLGERARQLAASVRLGVSSRRQPLLRRLYENHRFLDAAHQQIARAARAQEPLMPDAEWLLDNYYIVADVLRQVSHDLPRGYYAELPILAQGPLAGCPRIYELAVALIAHTDSFLEDTQIVHFVSCYQKVVPLTIGELWAIPTMLRLALLENLRHLAGQMLHARNDRAAAMSLAKQVADSGTAAPLPAQPRDAFLVALQQAVRDHAGIAEVLHDWLAQHNVDTAEALQREHQRQAANQVSIGNCVTSLRLINVLDWSVFFEKVSLVEQTLRQEAAGTYARQDFASRDRCRRAVEKLARGSQQAETVVAEQAIARADAALALPERHVGWHLLGAGQHAFARKLGYRPKFGDRCRSFVTDHPGLIYFGLLTLFLVGIVAATVALTDAATWWLDVVVGLVALLPASELAVGLTNYLVCRLLPPRVLAKLDFKDGIAEDCSTFVVIPSMLSGPDSALHLLERLELHYLANPDPHLRFALLTDFADAPAQTMPEDDGYVQAALAGVRRLNERYSADGPERFFLFHRQRRRNEAEGSWMGWERKRGKLQEFNRLLRGATDTSYAVQSGTVANLPHFRFVLTLDADTVLPREATRQMVSALAHPLNQPVLTADGRRVASGYAILQPRVSFLYRTGMRSLFARIFAGSAGIDPYSSAVSDVYQDLFGQGTFTGKGLYDIDAFEATAGRAFPENSILSHDLIESDFARCALATDVEVFDDFPAKYHAYARREHRWVRGDWQLLPWLGPRVPTPRGKASNPLPLLERWKILDNLRRSLVPSALVLLLALGWTVLPGAVAGWTAFALGVLALPLLLYLFDQLLSLVHGTPPHTVLRQVGMSAQATVGQLFLTLTFLANQAFVTLDAIVRTLARLLVTRRHMLEWETAAAAERRLGDRFVLFVRTMWPGSVLALVLAGLIAWQAPQSLWSTAPVLALWFFAPAIAYLVGRPLHRIEPVVSEQGTWKLRGAARKIWGFFETFIAAEDNWLPPDNYQEEPKGQIAHRTSPTNMGLGMLSTLAAHDLGWLTLPQLSARLGNTYETLAKLERYHGHFLNWYDTQTLKPLLPAYVSTVDSGNFLGCLWALKNGLLEKLREPVPPPNTLVGLTATLQLVAAEVQDLQGPEPQDSGAWRGLSGELEELRRILTASPASLLDWEDLLARAEKHASGVATQARGLGDMLAAMPDNLLLWANRLLDEVHQRRSELQALAPWLPALQQPDTAAAVAEEVRRELAVPASLQHWEKRLPEIHGQLQRETAPAALRLAELLEESTAATWAQELRDLADQAEALAAAMDFRMLYNNQRHLFSVGYNVTSARLDAAHYDLLASEACLTSFLAVARGDAPRKHWFQLGRLPIRVAGRAGLMSWGGTMFEYLMPRLLLPIAHDTLLDTAERAAVARQMEYGRQKGHPWGISESAYYYLDNAQDYQYQSFGVPGLGLKRDLGKDYVIAPYATLLAVGIDPNAVLANLEAIDAAGGEGQYGFYEAIDCTPDRLPRGKAWEVVRSYMAHHQGMALVALANRLTGNAMPRRLRAEPRVRAAELLLEERVPYDAPLVPATEDTTPGHQPALAASPVCRRLTTPETPGPRTQLLSNGQYTVLLTNAGSGFSTCHGLDVTRWRADRTMDAWGQFIYLRDRDSGRVWSCGYQPTLVRPESYEVVYSIDKAEYRRVDHDIHTLMEVTVAPDKNVEVRRVTLHNNSTRRHELELTSYAEIVLGPHAADRAHPAFGKLFLETEWVPASHALLCRRRPRSEKEKPVWAVHVVAAEVGAVGETTYDTDRAKFLGRRRNAAEPAALDREAPELSGTTGPVLDPIFSLRRRLRLEPGSHAVITFATGMVDTREEALALADQFQTPQAVNRALDLAWAHARVELRHLRVSMEEAHIFQRLAGHILFPSPALRARPEVIAANRLGQSGLWRMGISGDLPIVLVRMAETKDLPLFEKLLAAHAYWRSRGLQVDLVLLNEEHSGYFEELHQQALSLLRASDERDLLDKPGGVFLRKAQHLADEDRTLLQAAARVVLLGERGPLASQIDVLERARPLPAKLPRRTRARPATARDDGELRFFNGVGGFTPDGLEYVVPASSGAPPAPWINVVANPDFGFLVSDSGSGFTWSGNSQTNRLTPWSNDPVSDPAGEALYLRDEATGEVWSPTPLPIRDGAATEVRHGHGYTLFHQVRGDLDTELTLFVPPDAPVKLWLLRLRNQDRVPRRLSATFYAEWVLGVDREQTGMHIVTSEDAETGTLLARCAFNADFGQAIAFADVNLRTRTLTGDRAEFIGRHRSTAAPAALERTELSGRTGAGLDPCAALQAKVDLAAGEEKTLVFLLGEAPDVATARQLAQRYRRAEEAEKALHAAVEQWDRLLGAVEVQTPDPAMDVVLNRWLLYQTVSCRLWGRSAFYQSGGAYGFRDQLQDVMALCTADPQEARLQILRSAQRQFLEGDVQHWWHPPAGNGIRTKFSDDFLWLPYVVCHYVTATGDVAILEEKLPFLKAPPLTGEQEEVYGRPDIAEEKGTLFDHCVRALDNGWKLGPHGLPLMGTGDWNDGMNKVGAGGKGESVWVAWFQMSCLVQFAALAEARGDAPRAEVCRHRAEQLRQATAASAWDGAWYLRAFFDDGTPLGSHTNDECQIDSLGQTWAVICGLADPERARQAMQACWDRLVRMDDKLILLFDPPFDTGKLHPGYIKGYVPGIRENGGQYTHAATWVVLATALLGQGTRAHGLFGLLNPVCHTETPEAVARYRVEPYVVAADIYGRPPHVGRGGWTWYTGSSGWLYRVGIETLLGFQREGQQLRIDPCIPDAWPGFTIQYRHGATLYRIKVENPDHVEHGVKRVLVDGHEVAGQRVDLVDDGRTREVRVEMGQNPGEHYV